MNMFLASTDTGARPFLLKPVAGGPRRRLGEGGAVFRRSKERLRLRLYATLFGLDLLCATLAFLVVGALRFSEPLAEQTLRTLAIVLPTFVAIALNNQAYSLRSLERPSKGAAKAVGALLYAIALAIALLFSLKASTVFSRIMFTAGTLLAIAAVFSGRMAIGAHLGRKYRWVFANQLVIVDSVPWDIVQPRPVILAERIGLNVMAEDPLLLHRLNELLEHCDRVIVACPPERRRKWADALTSTAIDVEMLTPELNSLGAKRLTRENGETMLLVSSGPLRLHDRLIKRALDLGVASAALIILAPLLLLLAIAIKLESPGPILFRQPRFGQNNRMFQLLKFRSMRAECTDAVGVRSTGRSDNRVTRIGGFIRRTSLDELPQLLNVLKGEMSIVGPRPHAVGSTAEDALFWQIDRRYFDRHAIKPGITGLAQIRGFRGATICRDDLTNRLQSDLEYVSGWTIWRDLKIILATAGVLVHANAY